MLNKKLQSIFWTAICAFFIFISPAVVKAEVNCSNGSVVNVVAHEDDDILFLSPDLLHDIQLGKCITTIFLTAGDNNQGSGYWRARENGAQAAYAYMSGGTNLWYQGTLTISGHTLVTFSLIAHPEINLIFIRLPDGNTDGNGFSNNNYESLQKLWQGNISIIHSVDASNTYTSADLISTLSNLFNTYQPDTIRTQDYVYPYSSSDHSDHTTTANIALASNSTYRSTHTFVGYVDYPTSSKSINVFAPDLVLKQNTFLNYATYDPDVCQTLAACQPTLYGAWLQRQYQVGTINPPSTDSFTGQYFNNTTLTGTPVLTRSDAAVNFNWGLTSPGSGINTDNFSARWTKSQSFTAGSYKFTLTGDDGIRLKVDGVTVIDKWIDQPATTYTTDVTLTAGNHDLIVEYYDKTENAVAKLSWVLNGVPTSTPTPTPTPTSGPTPTPSVDSFTGQYFNNTTLTGTPVLTRSDAAVNFNWGLTSPGSGINTDNFSARWTKSQSFTAGSYKFTLTGDDGIRLKVDGVTVIDKWIDQPATTYTTDVTLTAGNHDLIVEYYDKTENAVAKLSWVLNGVPTSTPTPTPTPTSGPTPTPSVDSFTGQYFNNTTLTGTPVLTRSDAAVNFNWGLTSPGSGINTDNFSARWTKSQSFTAGSYKFTLTGDDGIRLKVDGVTVIDKWIDQPATTYTTDVTLTAGNHDLIVEYYDKTENAVAKLSWVLNGVPTSTPTPTPTPTSGPTPTPSVDSFTGQYFNNTTLTGTPVLTRSDAAVNFNWGLTSPGSGINTDNFSARWTKSQSFTAGSYKFTLTGDDGIRLKVDGVTVIDKWIDQPATTYTTDVTLTAGNHDLIVEYYDKTENAVAKLSWVLNGVPTSTPTPTPTPTSGPTPTPSVDSFTGQYFNNTTLTGTPVLTRSDAAVNFNWGLTSPGSGINTDNFSARWTKSQSFTAGSYKFTLTGDDGIRLKVDGVTVIDKWIDQPATTYTTDVTLTAGNHDLIVEYYDKTENAVAKLSWVQL